MPFQLVGATKTSIVPQTTTSLCDFIFRFVLLEGILAGANQDEDHTSASEKCQIEKYIPLI